MDIEDIIIGIFFSTFGFFLLEAIFYAITQKRFVLLVRIFFEGMLLLYTIIQPIIIFEFKENRILRISYFVILSIVVAAYIASARIEPFSQKMLTIINSILFAGIILVIGAFLYEINMGVDFDTIAVITILSIVSAQCLALLLAILRNIRIRKTDENLFGPIE